jgi:hypothetical protein
MVENKVPRIFGSIRKGEGAGDEEHHNFYFSLDIISVFKLRRIKWAGHIACIEQMTNAYVFWSGNLKRRNCCLL